MVMEVVQHFLVRRLCFQLFMSGKPHPLGLRFPRESLMAEACDGSVFATSQFLQAGHRLQLSHRMLCFFCRTYLHSAHKVDSF